MENAFGKEISEIKNIASDNKIKPVLLKIMEGLTRYLGIDSSLGPKFIELAGTNKNVYDYEKAVHDLVESEKKVNLKDKLLDRSKLMYKQISPYLTKGTILDFGCGDGKIGEMFSKEGYNVILADVYKHPHIEETGLDFELLSQKGIISAPDNSFDNCIVLTVLHHSDFPLENIEELYRVTKPGGKVIVIESVFDVHGEGLSKQEKDRIKHFLELNDNQQFRVCCFFDHFFNRIFYYSDDVKKKVNMPYNYNTPDGWKELFEGKGFGQKKLIHLGLDQPLGPAEYHTLHIFVPKK